MGQGSSVLYLFRHCVTAIQGGKLIRRESRSDKEYHFQNWIKERLDETGLYYDVPGRNTYPDFSLALALDPKKAAAYVARGTVYADQGQLDKALADFNQALALDPQNAAVYYERGLLHSQRGERDAAIADFQQARDLSTTAQERQNAIDRLKELGAS